ncbi:cytochrome P450 [Nocardia seriolae]|uniref:Cytochrome P450 n=1 Tax=Nocardia seriolae TaxID=37332 RepID=A0A0B8NGW9_9NOCA|nr:cytochrome P450 [Nocardia seriolae]APA98697.1 Unspecific monooxygenase [Nocardia seriolae]MTJ63772.1 cytochrome P450 [Nocardia seriolae]MTJ74001.1 cytochrome P450 [Nocardia seriolae]MTJ88336.1 cytochrome P450 [Nocardia seriolae]MTK32321.1 cytochrome P450 [Nocardia seriolae]
MDDEVNGRGGGAVALREPATAAGSWLLGSTVRLLRDPLGEGMRGYAECGDVTRLSYGAIARGRTSYVINHPDGAAHVFAAAAGADYRKDGRLYQPIRDMLGDGLLTSQDEVWLRQRRLIAPLFTTRGVNGYVAAMTGEVGLLAAQWRARSGGVVDLRAEMTGLTLGIVTRVLFGADATSMAPVLRAGFPVLGRAVLRRAMVPKPTPLHWPTPANRRIARTQERIRVVCDEIIAARRAAPEPGIDLIGRLIAARDGDDALSDNEIRDQVKVFLFAGHDTTATLLTFALHLLGRHPEVQARVHDEATRALPAEPAAEDLAGLPYTTMVIKEAARLYPPAPYISRRTSRDTDICGYRIPAGADLAVSPWVIHHREDLWPDPFQFDPERFTPEREAQRHKFAWLPFGQGPRGCIGYRFAMLEAVLTLAILVRDFEFTCDPGDVRVTTDLVLHPVGAVPCRIRSRPIPARGEVP